MKKALAIVAVMGLAAAPVMALPIVNLDQSAASSVQLSGTPFAPGGSSRTPTGGYLNGSETVYDNMAGAFGVTGSTPFTFTAGVGGSTFIFDDIHINSSLSSATIGGMHWLFYNPGAGGTAGVTADTIAFFSNPGGANTAIGATIAAFGLSLGTGFVLQSVNFTGSGLVLPKDSWVGFRKSAAVLYTGGAPGPAAFGTASAAIGLGFGPTGPITSTFVAPITNTLLTGGGFVAFVTSPTGVPVGPQTGSLHIAMDLVPEPAAISLLSLGGLLALRRRRAA